MTTPAFDFKRLMYTAKTTKRYWIPLFIVVVAAVNSAMIFMPKKYQSSATVFINKPKLINIVGGQTGSVLNIADQLPTIREYITGDGFLKLIAHNLNLDKGLEPDSKEHQALIEKIRSGIELHVKNQDLFFISYQDNTPEQARNVASEIVKQYIEQTARRFESGANDIKAYLNNKLEVADRKLRLAQNKVTEYKAKYPNEIPEAQAENVRRLQQLEGDKRTWEATLESARLNLDKLKADLKKTPEEMVSQRTVAQNATLSRLQGQKNDAETNLSMLRHDFTEEHWKVKAAKNWIDQLDKAIASEATNTTSTEVKAPNPNYQTLMQKITDTEMMIPSAQTNIAKANQEIAKLEEWQTQVPARQLELNRLEQAMRVELDEVEMTRKKLNEAETTANVEERGQGPSFELRDAPLMQFEPVSPNPKKFAVLGVAMGGAVSAALIYLLMLLDSAVRSVDEARRMLQMPVLGIVQRIITTTDTLRQARRRRFRTMGFGLGAALLLGVVVLGMTVLRAPLQHQVETIRNLLSK